MDIFPSALSALKATARPTGKLPVRAITTAAPEPEKPSNVVIYPSAIGARPSVVPKPMEALGGAGIAPPPKARRGRPSKLEKMREMKGEAVERIVALMETEPTKAEVQAYMRARCEALLADD